MVDAENKDAEIATLREENTRLREDCSTCEANCLQEDRARLGNELEKHKSALHRARLALEHIADQAEAGSEADSVARTTLMEICQELNDE
jgi:hypothetical protein